jgi:hypothetical protein
VLLVLEKTTLKQSYRQSTAFKKALLGDLPVFGTNARWALSDPKQRVSCAPVVWGAPCLVLHTALNPLEARLLRAMCAVLLPEKGYGVEPDPEIPCLLLSHQVQHETLVQHMLFWKPAALWLVGEKVAQFFLKTRESLAQLRAKQPLPVLLGNQLPLSVIATEHPRDISDDIVAKRRIYQDLLRLKADIFT